jgi:hypothetical protein
MFLRRSAHYDRVIRVIRLIRIIMMRVITLCLGLNAVEHEFASEWVDERVKKSLVYERINKINECATKGKRCARVNG